MNSKVLSGIVLDEETLLSLGDLCQACSRHAEWIVELVDEGILQPTGRRQEQWRFPGTSLQRARTALRLQEDLHINLAGVALALDLMDEIESLRALVRRLE
ncbi:MAG TPA: MerR family transcriptional regulator [Gammaproteobacteria bacterium]|nr:MerR family transcriptional regulator [Gammaproteobacteria bacterium]